MHHKEYWHKALMTEGPISPLVRAVTWKILKSATFQWSDQSWDLPWGSGCCGKNTPKTKMSTSQSSSFQVLALLLHVDTSVKHASNVWMQGPHAHLVQHLHTGGLWRDNSTASHRRQLHTALGLHEAWTPTPKQTLRQVLSPPGISTGPQPPSVALLGFLAENLLC